MKTLIGFLWDTFVYWALSLKRGVYRLFGQG